MCGLKKDAARTLREAEKGKAKAAIGAGSAWRSKYENIERKEMSLESDNEVHERRRMVGL